MFTWKWFVSKVPYLYSNIICAFVYLLLLVRASSLKISFFSVFPINIVLTWDMCQLECCVNINYNLITTKYYQLHLSVAPSWKSVTWCCIKYGLFWHQTFTGWMSWWQTFIQVFNCRPETCLFYVQVFQWV